MAVTKRSRASARAHRRAAATSHPCCPDASELVVLAMATERLDPRRASA